jgi:hypothetical protein
VLLTYLRQCYTLEEQAFTTIDTEQFQAICIHPEAPPNETVGQWLMSHLVHEWEHLGMMRYLQGLAILRAEYT